MENLDEFKKELEGLPNEELLMRFKIIAGNLGISLTGQACETKEVYEEEVNIVKEVVLDRMLKN
ncbi:MAG: hypothetical protein ABIG60_00440 [Patescibacteria group bacterium]